MASGVKYSSTAALWRDLAFMRANRRRMEEISGMNPSATFPPFDYHKRRREILKVLAARTRKAA